MNLRTLEIYCEVVVRRSFSKAARSLGVSQSLASQTVSLIEERLGSQLIDRSSRPFELTSAGEEYFEGCRKLLSDFRRLEDGITTGTEKVNGRLRVAAIYSAGLLQMERYVGLFRQNCPDVEFSLEYLQPAEVYTRVTRNDVDLGIVSFPKDNSDFSCIPWQDQPLTMVVAASHPLAGQLSVSVQDLNGKDFVAFTRDLEIRRRISRWLRKLKLSVNVVQEFDSIEHIKRAVEIGTGISVLPQATALREVEFGTLATVDFCDVKWFRPLGIVHRRAKPLSKAAAKFVELLHEPVGGQGAEGFPGQIPELGVRPDQDFDNCSAVTDSSANGRTITAGQPRKKAVAKPQQAG
jgi:DNA-binding transcriptional LysR family regulator